MRIRPYTPQSCFGHVAFGQYSSYTPQNVTAFDQYAQSIGLYESGYKSSKELKAWAKRNRFTKYVPEDLLIFWGLRVSEEDDMLFTLK